MKVQARWMRPGAVLVLLLWVLMLVLPAGAQQGTGDVSVTSAPPELPATAGEELTITIDYEIDPTGATTVTSYRVYYSFTPTGALTLVTAEPEETEDLLNDRWYWDFPMETITGPVEGEIVIDLTVALVAQPGQVNHTAQLVAISNEGETSLAQGSKATLLTTPTVDLQLGGRFDPADLFTGNNCLIHIDYSNPGDLLRGISLRITIPSWLDFSGPLPAGAKLESITGGQQITWPLGDIPAGLVTQTIDLPFDVDDFIAGLESIKVEPIGMPTLPGLGDLFWERDLVLLPPAQPPEADFQLSTQVAPGTELGKATLMVTYLNDGGWPGGETSDTKVTLRFIHPDNLALDGDPDPAGYLIGPQQHAWEIDPIESGDADAHHHHQAERPGRLRPGRAGRVPLPATAGH